VGALSIPLLGGVRGGFQSSKFKVQGSMLDVRCWMLKSVPLLGGVRGGFQSSKFKVQGSMLDVGCWMLKSVPLLGGVRGGFMVPMHARSERWLPMNLGTAVL